jgi:hypothetical protein
VDNADATQWSIGLTTATSQAWLGHRTPAARRAGADLALVNLIARIERVLQQEQAS